MRSCTSLSKQIEGAGLLVVNKIDLLPAEKLAQLKNLLKGRAFLPQNSLAEQGVSGWLDFPGVRHFCAAGQIALHGL